jgi:hypothetical protein
MLSGEKLEWYYQNFTSHLQENLPDGLLAITPKMTKELLFGIDSRQEEPLLTRYFQFLELEDKMVLLNHQFIIWIVPYPDAQKRSLTVFIAQNKNGVPSLELGFIIKGMKNPSNIVLKLSEKFLLEIQENEKVIKEFEGA